GFSLSSATKAWRRSWARRACGQRKGRVETDAALTGGGGEIRTLETLAGLPAFEAGALGRTMRLHRMALERVAVHADASVAPRGSVAAVAPGAGLAPAAVRRDGARRAAKKRFSSRPHSSAITPAITSTRWFSRSSRGMSYSELTA